MEFRPGERLNNVGWIVWKVALMVAEAILIVIALICAYRRFMMRFLRAWFGVAPRL